MTNWYEILKSHPLVEDGMREDDSVRAEALQSMDLPPVFQHFDAVANVTHNYDAYNYGDRLKYAHDDLPVGVQTVLHDAGVTHFLTGGETEPVVSWNEPLTIEEAGAYYSKYRTAVTETSATSIEATFRHEAGHALSYALGNADSILGSLASALEGDLKALSSQDWEKLEAMDVGYLNRLGWEPAPGHRMGLDSLADSGGVVKWPDGSRLTSRHYTAKSAAEAYADLSPVQKTEIEQLLPDFAAAVHDYDPASTSHLYTSLSNHPILVSAYQQDLDSLLTGNGPDGAKLGIVDGRAKIIVDGRPVLDVAHYVPAEHGGNGYADFDNPEEPFAEIFDNLHDPMVGPGSKVLSTYFPSMTAEVSGVLAALDRAYHNGKTPEPAFIETKEPAAELPSSELGLTHQLGATSAFYKDIHQFLTNKIELEGMRAGTIATYLMNKIEEGQSLTAATMRETLSQFDGEEAVRKLDDFLAAARPSPPEAAPELLHP